jgi:hypothetical protein
MDFAHAREVKDQQELEGVSDGSDYQNDGNETNGDYDNIITWQQIWEKEFLNDKSFFTIFTWCAGDNIMWAVN